MIHSEQIKTNLIEIGFKIHKFLMIVITHARQYNNNGAAAVPRLTKKNRVRLQALKREIFSEIVCYMTLET